MSTAKLALGSCSISVRDPATSTPTTGRLQLDVRTHPYGALTEFCDDTGLVGPNGEPLVGLAVDLYDVDQTTPADDPPAGYVNPLRVTSSGELYVDIGQRFEAVCSRTFIGTVTTDQSGSVSAPITQCISNPTGVDCRIERTMTIQNTGIENVQGPTGDIVYRINVDGGLNYNITRAREGQDTATSLSIELDTVAVPAGGTYTTTLQPDMTILGAIAAPVNIIGGVVVLCSRLICPPPSGSFIDTPTC